ncbi:MAG: hypothetical protein PWP39_1877 [Pyrococcus sp.]|uniref:RAMP superfamily CRISPR-associated protein n=1 Tax=Pyrococcus sp. TaxID=33866 RepID=UPI002586E21B|nr:RAMP superfamily CRISPR-associated protein [Pyrococcus sp.]MDK2870642.1 hypothetical protein [Pyrococcus sp.]
MKVVLKMKALEPISVGYESIGIETLLYSLPVIGEDGKPIDVPVLPGNSLRGVLRDQMALQFLEDVISNAKNNNKDVKAHIGTLLSLFSGGILAGKDNEQSKVEPNIIKNIMEQYVYLLLPLSIMGVAIKKIIIPGKLKVGIGYPLTEETKSLLKDLGVLQNDKEVPSLLKDIVHSVLITRKDDTSKVMQLKELLNEIQGEPKEVKPEDSAIQQRLYRQVVIPGTVFYSYVEDVIPMSDEEWGLVIKTLKRLSNVGGRVAGGLGKVKIEIVGVSEEEQKKFIQAYDNYISNSNNLKKILNALKTDPNSYFVKEDKEEQQEEE